MKRLIPGVVIGVVLIVLFVLVSRTRPHTSQFTVGSPLPPGKVAPQLVSAWDTGVLLAPDGSLWGWGGTRFQLPALFGKPTVTQTPQRIGSDSDWRAVAASHQYVLAQKIDGSLWGWGGNRQAKPTRIGTDTNWVQISVGAGHSLALKSDGSVWAWGQNDRGQVGDGTISDKSTPTRIGKDNDWKTIAAGAFNSFALKTDGTIWGWGLDPVTGGKNDDLSPRQIDPGANWTAISVGEFCLLGLKSDGTLWIGGQNAPQAARARNLTQIGPDADWREVYAGQTFFFARKKDGSWWVCGDNANGQLGIGSSVEVASPRRLPFDFEPWAFAPGYGNTVSLTRDGTLWTWGTRLGSGSNSRSLVNRLKGALNFILARVLGRPPFDQRTPDLSDPVPHRLWELPAKVRQSLGKAVPDDGGTRAGPPRTPTNSSPH
jgi:hypothetical protein